METKMKKIKVLLFSLFFVFSPLTQVNAQTDYEKITNFESDIELKQDTDIFISEKITYHFPESKHGIYRDIPVSYKVLGGFKRPTTLEIKYLKYYDVNNPSVIKDSYEESSSNGYIRLKIGNPDEYIIGDYIFEIGYILKDTTNYFDDHDELYLNITGNNWTVPIENVSANIKVPGNITKSVCYTGVKGSTESNCTIEDKSTDSSYALSVNAQYLDAGEGLTVAVAMPKGSLADTTARQRREFILSNIGILLPIPVVALVFFLIKKNNKNKKLAVVPTYTPPKDIYPLLCAEIVCKSVKNKDISAEIIQLAVDGYIKIVQDDKKKYKLVKTDKDSSDLEDARLTLLNGLFSGKNEIPLKSISTSFGRTMKTINSLLSTERVKKGYIDKKKVNIKNILNITGIVVITFSMLILSKSSQNANLGLAIGLLISGIILMIASTKLDIKTSKGNKLYYDLLGLKMYINTAEKRRIEFHNNPKKYSGVFEKLLPYAIIFGLEKKWVKEFKDIYKQPDWYQGDFDHFNAYMIVNSVSSMNKSFNARSVSYSSSSAGSWGSGFSSGSSGGGTGGGGGGSW
ncbi:MAG TPA: DUF2207 domain-containing protein [Candidatus Dojkabacteria bacterium]|jgi:uncharacterized membrane protein|nr:DUF2207 domain-containing protein [Candidatus Dojkabacteria bacterium]